MNETNTEPVQYTNPNGSSGLIKKRKNLKQTSLVGFLDQLEKKRVSKNRIETLGFFNNTQINLYEIDGEKWILLFELRKLFSEIKQASWIRFNRLSNEWIEDANRYFLNDYKYIGRNKFFRIFPSKQNIDLKKGGTEFILLSPDDTILYTSRSTKRNTKAVLIWLVKQLNRKRVEVKEIKTIWKYAKLLESYAEKEYFKEAILKINIQRLVPQKYIGKYRGDFVIDERFLIMIKGFFYHSKQDKLLADARRERYIEREGYIIIPFYAEDILLNPEGCVNKTIEIINKFRNYKRLKE